MADSKLSALREIRLEKAKKLRDMGIDPYPSKSFKEYSNDEIISKFDTYEGKEVTLTGRLMSWREHGQIAFGHIQDESGRIQIFVQEKELEDQNIEKQTLGWQDLSLLDVGDFVEASGIVGKTVRGEISLLPKTIRILSKSLRPLPSEWFGLTDVEDRYRQRYVDFLLNENAKNAIQLRSNFVKEIRHYMEESGFTEIETPVLQPIYGGASAQPFVTHHNELEADLYLRISDELYLKRLIVAGFEKVYEIGRVFRNEGMDRSHNPEFTMMEFYWAYANYEDLMKYTEEMLVSVIQKINGSLKVTHEETELDFTPPWPRKKFRDIIFEATGIDLDTIATEEELKTAIKEKRLTINMHGVVGYGMLCDKLYKEYIRPSITQPTFVIDYPSEMIALAKKKEDNPRKIASFQLLVKGYELLKAYNELNDPIDQEERWKEEERLGEEGLEDHMVIDDDYIRALEYGMPPTAGWGMGIDRITSILANQHTIKEVIAFPTLKPEFQKTKAKK